MWSLQMYYNGTHSCVWFWPTLDLVLYKWRSLSMFGGAVLCDRSWLKTLNYKSIFMTCIARNTRCCFYENQQSITIIYSKFMIIWYKVLVFGYDMCWFGGMPPLYLLSFFKALLSWWKKEPAKIGVHAWMKITVNVYWVGDLGVMTNILQIRWPTSPQ